MIWYNEFNPESAAMLRQLMADGIIAHGEVDGRGRAGNSKGQRSGPFNDDRWDGRWIDCPDSRQRLVEPGIPLPVNGFQHRRAILHAPGNAIVPQTAAAFIKAVM